MPAHWILAAADMARSLQNYQKRSFSFKENWLVLVVIGGVIVLGIGLYYWDKYRKEFIQKANSSGSPKSLFLDLCNMHELTRAERAFIQHAGEKKHLDDPALAFLDPQVLGELGRGHTGEAAAYAQLVIKLFGRPQSVRTPREKPSSESSPNENAETVAN
jgi:hypothetical protein